MPQELFEPIDTQGVRLRFDTDSARWVVEQERTRRANGVTDPNTLGSILDLDEIGWETRCEYGDIRQAVVECAALAFEENVPLREFDLGPFLPNSPTVVAGIVLLQQIRL